MPIINIQTDEIGQSGIYPRIVRLFTDDPVATVTTAGYLDDAVKKGRIQLNESDLVAVTTRASASAPQTSGWYEVSNSAGQWSLTSTTSPGSAILPTTANTMAYFNDTTGTIQNGSDAVTHAGALTADGNITAGSSGTEGQIRAYPATAASGSILIDPQDNTGDFDITILNTSVTRDITLRLSDPLSADTATLQTAAILNAQAGYPVLHVQVGINFSSLDSGGIVSLSSFQVLALRGYLIKDIYYSLGGTNFSGGGGDRDLEIYSGSTNYSTIPAATLQSSVNARWGSTDVPFSTTHSMGVGATGTNGINLRYTGGTTDYTAGVKTLYFTLVQSS